jgi:hypothetical protein
MPRKTKISTLEEYLKSAPQQKEMFEFDCPKDAYNFGVKLRENVIKEQDVKFWNECEGIAIDISNNVVRIKLLAQEPACV